MDESGDATADHLRVTVEDPRCSVFVGRYLDGVTVGPSPIDVQRRLMSAGVRPISNVVDASNYVMLELGKPIHTFDAAAITDGHIVVRAGATAASGWRRSTTSSGTLDPDVLLIADPAGPLAIAGVMGGATSEVGEGDHGDRRGVGHLRPREHPAHRVPLRAALGGEPRASRRARSTASRAWARTGRRSSILRWAGGRAAHRRGGHGPGRACRPRPWPSARRA